jgi:hypothetical protein
MKSPAFAALTAVWIFVAAVSQEEYGAVGAGLLVET